MDAAERRVVAEKHINLIVSLAKRVAKHFDGLIALDELISFGAEGAMRALQRYDPSKGKVATYIYPRIVGAMLDGIRSRGESRHNLSKWRIVKAIREELTQALERPPLADEVDQAIRDRGYRWYFRPEKRARPVRFHENLAQPKPSQKPVDPGEIAANNDRIEHLLRGLSERDKAVARMRICDEKSLATIGEAFGMSESWAALRWKQIKPLLQQRMIAVEAA